MHFFTKELQKHTESKLNEKSFLGGTARQKLLTWRKIIPPKELFIWEKPSYPGETSHLSEISTEWCISLCKSISFISDGFIPPSWDLTSTQVRSHLGGMIFLHVNSFWQAAPPRQDCSFSLDSACFYIYYVEKCSSSYKV